jgi:hypothetical protein
VYLRSGSRSAAKSLRAGVAGVVEAPYSPRATHRKLMPRRELLPGQCRRYRHLGAPRQSSSHPVRSRSVSRPSPAPKPDGSAALRATREFGHFGALTASLPEARSRQSSARHDFQSKSREPSFESKLGGVGPVVAGALDRPRRLILTAAAASDGSVQICSNICYIVANIAT